MRCIRLQFVRGWDVCVPDQRVGAAPGVSVAWEPSCQRAYATNGLNQYQSAGRAAFGGARQSISPSAHDVRPMIRPSSDQSILICQPSTKMPSSFKVIGAPQSILISEIRPIQMRLGSCHLRRCWLSRCSA